MAVGERAEFHYIGTEVTRCVKAEWERRERRGSAESESEKVQRFCQCKCDYTSRVCEWAVTEVRILSSQRMGERGSILPDGSILRNNYIVFQSVCTT